MTFVGENKEKAVTAVFDKNYETLCLYAVRFTEDLVEAEDVVQEAFVRFWEMYRDRLTVENARPLLYRMVRNMCVDRARAKRWSTVDAEVMADQLVYYFQPESEGDSKIDLLMEAVRNLPEKCQQVLIASCSLLFLYFLANSFHPFFYFFRCIIKRSFNNILNLPYLLLFILNCKFILTLIIS